MCDSPGRPIMEDVSKASPSIRSVENNTYMPPPVVLEIRRSDRMKKNLISFAKKFLVFMVSQVGLTCLVIGYSIMGGFIFMKLEAEQEIQNKVEVGFTRQFYVKRLWDVTQNLNILFEANWSASADEIFQDFQQNIYKTVRETGWDGTETEEASEWTYAGALLYSVTVITTIGYGHLTPRTFWGRLATIIYAIVGIPLTLLCLTNIGTFMAKCFRFFWKKIPRCRCEKRSYQGRILHRKSDRGRTSYTYGNEETVDSVVESPPEQNNTLVRIPIFVCLLLLAGYIFLGAMLFTLWEPEWNYLEGSYFCFITLSTIGFGDYVPGYHHDSWHNQAKRVSCTLYLLFGLALISMCFDLIQSEVREIFKGLARAMGISKSGPDRV
ncbi:TWiK family of potassium channels protein 18-like [Haliotis rubra]|uniref:TWiK family of potassium channels protein 18-like n=1 Tax=Haliotis rubra TaxID=36100 RepID=UPI001EE5E2B5|nr:TWiK family of potassium channels protein 18-like [Haliotis rubra]XP_046568720.1 TWiK family of potassium channels protein 18-like [Haliotis rubra]XP_046568721.1 TWiK family of potassium channels protein 18-like [Haliotis rubra]